ncbi:hypothetical protein CXZ10_17475 [Pleomorphomonas diazotrophica]|uniref:Uncharacterized protein n=2 Tax=Pleomorphomonas diazotrophica TaxID=1166257 RepID=A0A1I4W702_9HYPH|nr:hypothetical protein CXZ10_17475 [Pleomorphomonas diazotrophica]SFN09172.1 hypothetical protein SAMN05192571_11570 [Pleomorphomonas diazotrophica]
MKVQQAEAEKTKAEAEAARTLNNNDTHLPNITNLSLESAIKMKGFVEVDIEQGLDGAGNIFGHYGDRQVSSLKEYLSLLNAYIDGESSPSTPPTSAQPTTPGADTPASHTPTQTEPVVGADPNWTDPVGKPGQNHIFFPNVASLTRETAAAVYRQVSDMVKTQDTSASVIHARNGSAGTYSVDTYMPWLAQRAAVNIEA